MIGIFVCMLMIISVFPAVGFSIQTAETTNSNFIQPHHQAPLPAYAPIPSSYVLTDVSVVHEHPEKEAVTMDDVVISIIEQVDESIFLSYEENLTANGPRPTGSASCIAAAEYMYDQFQNMGLAVRYHPWSNGGYSSNNVEATINGTDDSSDDIYIICAHYDTVSAGVGADDDTSGTAAVLIAASVMSQYHFNHTIKFVAFSGEEQGLLGSEVYAQEAAAQGWDIIGVLNCDMISYAITTNDGNNLDVYQNSASAWLYTYTRDINTEYSDYIGPLTLHNAGTSSGSDHYYFWQFGYSALFYFEYEMTPYYHTSQDTIENINLTYAVKNTRLILATLAELSEARLPSDPPAQPTKPVGKTLAVWNREYSYTSVTTDPNGDQIFYMFYWGDGSNSGWLGPYSSGQTGTGPHIWTVLGTYEVTVKAKDINGAGSSMSEPLIVVVTDNTPPFDPTITGPGQIKPKVTYTFTFNATDEFDHDVTFDIDWGDGNGLAGLGPYNSGELVELTHSWAKKGTYSVRAKATDIYGMESNWTYLEIVCPTDYQSSLNTILQHLFERFPHIFPVLRYLIGY